MQKPLVWLALVACSNPAEETPVTAAAPAVAAVPAPPVAQPIPAPAADDPWQDGKLAPEAPPDPWAKAPPPAPPPGSPAKPEPVRRPAPAAPTAPTTPASGASTLAGSYACQQLRYGTTINGMSQSTYVSSALGSFVIGADGTYRSASYASKGAGRATAVDASTVRFSGGAYANAIGQSGTTGMGFYIRFAGNLTDAPAASMKFDDHMCYRK